MTARRAARVVPDAAAESYDVRIVVRDVVDADSLFELRPGHAPNIVIGLAHLDGRAVGIVANQPFTRAGALDIDASRKAARFVQWCDAFNLPILTFVDTPGFEPGKDLEWRGMIRHGAQLVHAYAAATVPRLCVVLRKAYGGAYIVMDSKRLGNDYCVAWPGAQIAVMGANGAVQILHSRRLDAIDDPVARAAEQSRLIAEYEAQFSNSLRRRGARIRRRRDRPARHPSRPGRRAGALRVQARDHARATPLEPAALSGQTAAANRRIPAGQPSSLPTPSRSFSQPGSVRIELIVHERDPRARFGRGEGHGDAAARCVGTRNREVGSDEPREGEFMRRVPGEHTPPDANIARVVLLPHPPTDLRVHSDLLELAALDVVGPVPPPVDAVGEHRERDLRWRVHLYRSANNGAVVGSSGHRSSIVVFTASAYAERAVVQNRSK